MSRRKRDIPPSERRPRKTWQEALSYIAGAQVAVHRHFGKNDNQIRLLIAKAFEDAFDGREKFIDVVDVEGQGPTDVLSMAGCFRLVFNEWGMVTADQRIQELWWSIAKAAMERELSNPSGKHNYRAVS